MSLGPISINRVPSGVACSWKIIREVYPRPLLSISFDSAFFGEVLHWYVVDVPEDHGLRESTEEQWCRGIPQLDIILAASSGRLLGIDLLMFQDSLETIDDAWSLAKAEFQTPVFDTRPWGVRNQDAIKIRATAAPLRMGLIGRSLAVLWYSRGESIVWERACQNLNLAFKAGELVGFQLLDMDRGEVGRAVSEL